MLEAGVITKYILGDENGNAFAAGCAITSDFIKDRYVARRFAAVWRKGDRVRKRESQEARKYLAKNTLTPEDVVDTVPMVRYFMAGELTDKHKAEFRNTLTSTAVGTLPEKSDAPASAGVPKDFFEYLCRATSPLTMLSVDGRIDGQSTHRPGLARFTPLQSPR